MFGRPACSNCGHRLLVARIRTSGALFPPSERYYRCYRCFAKFTPDDEGTGEDAKRNVPESVSLPTEARTTARIVNTRLTLEAAGTKHAVEKFEVTIKNESEEPVRVTHVLLSFDGEEEKTTPKDEVVIPPKETETIDVLWSWIHPDQRTVTIDVRNDEFGSLDVVEVDPFRDMENRPS